ncbi:MAG TPA: OmpH family outer membrane protein [Gemmatimonadaceae bacterium]|nr:OmpH family outer membrane protein [Gemmatimonadaceae bacterium]
MRSTFRAAALAAAALAIAGTSAAAQNATPARVIAYVNPQALFEAAPGRADAEAQFRKETEGFRSELNKLNEALNQAVSDYQKAEAKLTAPDKERRQRALQAKEDSLRARQQELEQAASRRQNELMAPIMEQVRKVLEDIRAEDGYAVILSSEPGASPILAADKNLDITERVVARLRTTAAVRTTTPPVAAPKPAVGAPANTPSGVTRPKPPGA